VILVNRSLLLRVGYVAATHTGRIAQVEMHANREVLRGRPKGWWIDNAVVKVVYLSFTACDT